jgi:hypothetical protein
MDAPLHQTAPNALYLDNLTVTCIGSEASKDVDEAAVIPDRFDPVYQLNDPVQLTVNAQMPAGTQTINATLQVRSDLDDTVLATCPLTLAQTRQLPENKAIYQAKTEIAASRFGSYHTVMTITDQSLRIIGGRFAVLHPAVTHPRFSPGWSIGYNATDVIPAGRCPLPYDYVDYRGNFVGSYEYGFKLAHQTGMSLQRLWGYWRTLEPTQNQWQTDVIDPVLKLDSKYGLDVIFTIAGNLTVPGDKNWIQSQQRQGRLMWPAYLLKYHHDEGNIGSINPPADVFEKYLNFAIDHFGSQVHLWEVFNEPGIGGFPAQAYLGYLKQTYDAVKQKDPDGIVLGNGVTGDFGMNVIKWCQQLNAADPGYTSYLDGVAFHPYQRALDYQDGHYNQYTQCIADIRKLLKDPKPLWNTECFYLIDAKKPQIPWFMNQVQFGANEIQRHILESKLNGVVGISSLYGDSLTLRDAPITVPALSQVAVGTNSLSFLLKDMRQVQAIALNRYVKAGLFTTDDGKRGLGFVYDLRPEGSRWQLPADRQGVQLLDLFGNPVKGDVVALHYEPHYLLGDAAAIRKLFAASSIQSVRSLEMTGRIFNDALCLQSYNVSGVDTCTMAVQFQPHVGLTLPKEIAMSFTSDKDSQTMLLNHAISRDFDRAQPVTWTTQTGSQGTIEILPDTGCYSIPMSEDSPLQLSLNQSGKLDVWADLEALHVRATVAEAHLDTAKGDDLWNGDAVEVFIDPHPMEHLDQAAIAQGHTYLDAWQYLFAAGNSRQLAINRFRDNPPSQATYQVQQTEKGYTLTASIPWKPLLSQGNLGQVIGMDIEVDHADGDQHTKESLGKMPGRSYQQRLHYPLFGLPDAVVRKYRSLLGQDGDPAVHGSYRIDLCSDGNSIALTFDKGSADVSGQHATWMDKDNNKRLLIVGPASGRWQSQSFTFTPATSGNINLILMGNQEKSDMPWCCLDDFQVQGAAPLRNGDFEQIDDKQMPVGWYVMNQPQFVRDVAGAQQGDCYVITNHNNRFIQKLAVVQNQPVTVSFLARCR